MTIRIAPGPPSEEGWYWVKTFDWMRIVEVHRSRYSGKLHVGMDTLEEFLSIMGECQWSTRIPDPEE